MSTVTISLSEYEELLESAAWLGALEHAGVDNWEGYDEAVSIYEQMNEVKTPHLTVVK
jgi:hypothetical protein